MIPFIQTPFGDISTFSIMIVIAVLSMFASLHIILRKKQFGINEEIYIIPKIIFSALIAFTASAIFDALFKFRENGGFVLKGVTFYGGLIGAVFSMYILLRFSKRKTSYTIKQWYDILTIPLIVFHFFGRIGCFLAGCCYGKNTKSPIGIYFPDNAEAGIFHNGAKCYPTQLFEAAALILIFILVLLFSEKFMVYLFSYATARFFIEFFRGDDRGYLMPVLSPAQIISIIIIISIIGNVFYKKIMIGKTKLQ